MKYLAVKFKVKEDKISECTRAIEDFIRAIRENEPGTLRYEAYQLEEKTKYLHIMSFKDDEAEQFHRNTPHVKKFVEILYPNCDEQPEFTQLNLIGTSKELIADI